MSKIDIVEKFSCCVYKRYTHNKNSFYYSRIWYKHALDSLIKDDASVSLRKGVVPKHKSKILILHGLNKKTNRMALNYSIGPIKIKPDYCNIESFSKTSTQLYSFNITPFNSKMLTNSFLKSLGHSPLSYCASQVYPKSKFWFVKPEYGTCGKGIIITTDPQKYIGGNTVIEESINMPLIRKRRWDLRIYVYHTLDINGNFKTYLFKNGIVRLCPDEFNSNDVNKRNMCTNTSLYTGSDLNNNLNYCMTKLPNYENIFRNLKCLIKQVHDITITKCKPIKYFFLETHLLGYDIIFSEDNKAYIIEINCYPHYITKNNTPEVVNMKKNLVQDIYTIIKDYYLKTRNSNNFILVSEDNIV